MGACELVVAVGGAGLMGQDVVLGPNRAIGEHETIDDRGIGEPTRYAQRVGGRAQHEQVIALAPQGNIGRRQVGAQQHSVVAGRVGFQDQVRAVAVAEDIGIVAGAALQDIVGVVGGAAVECVVAGLAHQGIGVVAAVHDVVAGAAFGAVVATQQIELVVAGVADEDIGRFGAVTGVSPQVGGVPVRIRGVCKLHVGDASDLAGTDGGEEAQQAQRAAVGGAEHEVRPVAQQGDLCGREVGVDEHAVQARGVARHRGIDPVVATAVAEAIAVAGRVGAADQQVVTGAAIERVAAALAVQAVGAGAALHVVVAARGVDGVGAAERVDVVAVAAAVQRIGAFGRGEQRTAHLGMGQHLVGEDEAVHLACVLVLDQEGAGHAQAVTGGGEGGEQVGRVARERHVLAADAFEHHAVGLAYTRVVAVQGVRAKARGEVVAVVARATVERVVAGAADQGVVARLAEDRVAAAQAVQRVGAGAAANQVVARCAQPHGRLDGVEGDG